MSPQPMSIREPEEDVIYVHDSLPYPPSVPSEILESAVCAIIERKKLSAQNLGDDRS